MAVKVTTKKPKKPVAPQFTAQGTPTPGYEGLPGYSDSSQYARTKKLGANGNIFGAAGDTLNDAARNLFNFGGSVADAFTGGTPAKNSGFGDYMFGAAAKGSPKPSAPAGKGSTSASKKAAAPLSLLDYLNAASQLLGSGAAGPQVQAQTVQAPDFSGLATQATSQAGQIGAQLQAMYNSLGSNIQSQAPDIGQTFDNATQAVTNNQQAATGDVNNAYQQARDAQTAQLQALGIGDAAGVLASQGGNAANDQAAAVGNIAQGGASSANQIAQNKGSALNYNTNIGNAALQQGTDKQSAVQMALQQQLAQIAQQQQSADSAAAAQNATLQQQADATNSQSGSSASPSTLLQFAQALQSSDPNSSVNKAKSSATDASQQQALLNSILKYMSSHPGESYAQAKKDLGLG